MVLRIERVSHRQLVILRLSGRLQLEHREELKAEIEACGPRVVLDLADVKLVDREMVCFLGVCEANGAELRHCSPYIRDWIAREKTASMPNKRH